jgi:hypothetical protein
VAEPTSRLHRWLRDPLAWLVVISTVATVAIGALLIGILGPGLQHMVSTQTREQRVADLQEKLAEAEASATPPPGDMGAILRDPSRAAPARPPAVRTADEEDEDDWGGARRARREERGESLRRQIDELAHLQQALTREQRQLRRQTREGGRWDPEGHRLRQLRLADLYEELERVEMDIRRLERQLGRAE